MPTTIKDVELLTVKECADVLEVKDRRVQQFIEEGRLQASKIGGRWFVTREELDRFAAIERKPGNLTGRPRVPRDE
jgi:excisionase family DNA binding protein